MTNRIRAIFIAFAVLVSALALTATYVLRSRLGGTPSATGPPARVEQPAPAAQETTPHADVEINPGRQQLIGVRTVDAKRASLSQTLRTVGVVRYDERRQADVNVKIEGWIRDLFVDYTGQTVRRGQALFTLYSPQVLTAETEYLLTLKSRDQMRQSQLADARERADQLVGAARQRLSLWDVPPADLAALDRDGVAHGTITVHAPADGFIVDKQAVQGMHVVPGQSLYKIADVSVVWVEAGVSETEMPLVRPGQTATVTLDAYPGDHYLGRVIYIYPYVDEQTRTNKVRYAFANRGGKLKPGMFANVDINVTPGEGIVVPANALLDSGREQIVFVARGEGRFEPRRVKAGRRKGDDVEILEGVKEGEQVAAAAAFFLDSESQLRGSLQSYEPGQAPAGTGGAQPQLTITFHTQPDPPKAGENQFEVVVKDSAGKPVENADVTIQFFMAAMPTMNMPAMRNEVKLPAAGGGTYRGTGQVMMAGRWDTTISITRNGQRIGSKQIPVIAQ